MVRVTYLGRSALSFLSFNLGWWAAALGAKNGYPWAGPALLPVLVGVHLRASPTPRGEGVFLALLTLAGFLIDSVLIKLDLFSIHPATGWAPLWLVSMWTLLGLTFESMLVWRKKLWTLLLAGALSGPLSYIWCEAVDLLVYRRPLWLSLTLHGVIWSALMPTLFGLRDWAIYTMLPELNEPLATQTRRAESPVEDWETLPSPSAWMAEPPGHHTDKAPPTWH